MARPVKWLGEQVGVEKAFGGFAFEGAEVGCKSWGAYEFAFRLGVGLVVIVLVSVGAASAAGCPAAVVVEDTGLADGLFEVGPSVCRILRRLPLRSVGIMVRTLSGYPMIRFFEEGSFGGAPIPRIAW